MYIYTNNKFDIYFCFQRRKIHHRRRQNQIARRCNDGLHYRISPEKATHSRRTIPLAPGANEVPEQGYLSRAGN